MITRRHRAHFFGRVARSGSPLLATHKHKIAPLRFAFLILLTLGAVSGWSFWGGQFMASLNPAIRMQLHMLMPTLDAWITPPEYTGLPPIMIATPVGARYDGSIIEVPAGSTITAHLAERDGDAPDLFVNGGRVAFAPDDASGFEVSQKITGGDTIAIRRGWQDIDSWRIAVTPDHGPRISFAEPPSVTEHKAVRLSYKAADDYGIASVVARITPQSSSPGIDNVPVDIPLALPDAREIQRVSFEDLTSYPWAGQPVQIQLIATNAAGRKTATDPVDFTVPARNFYHPIARALIEERRKLLQNPDDENVRNETANIMAGIAHAPATYQGDDVVLMALRTGAVRLVLDRGSADVGPVSDLLWQAAVRIEDGTMGIAEQRLHEAQRELADALDRKADAPEIQELVNRLRTALAAYLSALSTRAAHTTGPAADLSQAVGMQTNKLEPQDIEKTLHKIHDLSASGASEAARGEFLKLEQELEGIRGRPSFSEDMQHRTGDSRAHNAIQRLMQNF